MALVFRSFQISDLPPNRRYDGVKVLSQPLRFSEQRTGYGVRKLLICPSCGARRVKLLLHLGLICCHGCAPINIYGQRSDLYDGGGVALVTWHMKKLASAIGIIISWPFHYMDYQKPIGMRWKRWCTALKKLQAMEQMRFLAIFFGCRFTAGDIKARTSPHILAVHTHYELAEYFDFPVGFDGRGAASTEARNRRK